MTSYQLTNGITGSTIKIILTAFIKLPRHSISGFGHSARKVR